MKKVTRLYDVIKPMYQREMEIRKSKDDLVPITLFNDDFFNALAMHETNLLNLLSQKVFMGIHLHIPNVNVMEQFIFDFTQRFINRSIKYQTFDLFRMHFLAEVSVRADIINAAYGENHDDYLGGAEITKVTSDSNGESDAINTGTSLPQAMVEFDSVDYADSLDKSQNASKDHSEQSSMSIKRTPQTVEELSSLKNRMFADLDKKLFSQIF